MENRDLMRNDNYYNFGTLSKELNSEIENLRLELVELYKREEKLLKIIEKRDKQLAGKISLDANNTENTTSEGHLGLKHNPTPNSDKFKELESRYNALKKSKLGRIQLWYWRRKAGN